LQQKLTGINHHDRMLITYPNLGRESYPSSQWQTQHGPRTPYVLSDLYAWLESHSGFTNPAAPAPAHSSSITTFMPSSLSSNSTTK
jgi:hypothetical protein